jgi:hypothetical protein
MTVEQSIAHQRMAKIFNEWARRYADDPSSFSDILGEDGRPVEDYGERCSIYFTKLAAEMDASGDLPKPIPPPPRDVTGRSA